MVCFFVFRLRCVHCRAVRRGRGTSPYDSANTAVPPGADMFKPCNSISHVSIRVVFVLRSCRGFLLCVFCVFCFIVRTMCGWVCCFMGAYIRPVLATFGSSMAGSVRSVCCRSFVAPPPLLGDLSCRGYRCQEPPRMSCSQLLLRMNPLPPQRGVAELVTGGYPSFEREKMKSEME